MGETNQGLCASAAIPNIQAMLQTYRGAVNTVVGYISRAVALLENLHVEQGEAIRQLKGVLARNSSLRHADFDGIFAVVLARRGQTRQLLMRLAQDYSAGREAVLRDLQDMFKSNVARAQDAWPGLKVRLLEEQDDGARQAVAALRRMHVEQEELSAALAGLLIRGEKLRIDDLKTVSNRLAKRDSRSVAELADLLAGCETAGRQANETWQRLAG